MSITPLRFTGVSTFSTDFQSILTRAVSIATLPVKQMQNDQVTLIAKKQALTAIGSDVASLASAITNLGQIGDTSALTVSSSNANRVTVTNNGLTSPATYTITEITSVAKAASETTAAGLATSDSTAVDADGQLELVFGGNIYAIDVSSANNLDALAEKINDLGLGLTATVLNTGSVSNPFFLSLTSSTNGETTLQLNDTAGDSGSNLLTAVNQGANAIFKLNGLPVSKSDNIISDVVPNLTFNIVSKTAADEVVTLSAQSSRGSLATALQTFVDAYNKVSTSRNSQIGSKAGILSGDFLINQLGRTLHQVTAHSGDGSGTIQSLADIGIELDKNGKMSFKTVKFYSLPSPTINDAYGFFKSTDGGFGTLASTLDAISNPLTGMIKTQQDLYDLADDRISNQIDILSERINQMQTTLQTRLEQADALLSTLQSQQALLKASYDSVNLALYGKQS